jgi:hypothetical protein
MTRSSIWLIAGAVMVGGLADAAPGATRAYGRLLCRGRSPCKVGAVTAVDPDGGQPQVVVTLLTSDGDSDAFAGCAMSEHWLVTGGPDHPARRQLLASGYSGQCASVGDEATISTSTFGYEDMVGGGHPDHYSHAQSLSLAPLGYAEEHGNDAARYPGTNVGEYAWSWSAFAGTGGATYFRCDAAGDPLSDREPTGPTVRWATIPALPKAVAGVTELGACSTFVDGAKDGFTIFGKPGTAEDASFRAAIVGRELLVEVTDDHWVDSNPDWTFDDHVEIWLTAAASPQRLDKCEDLRARDAVQFGVRIADGAVFAAAGHPTDKLTARRSPGALTDGQPVLLSITLPRWFDAKTSGVTVVYSDSDDGATQERLIATSELKFGRRYTIGRARAIAPREATCTANAGRLEPALQRTFKANAAMIGWSGE